ncbi:MAG TPA: hypothetical protein VNJ01_11195 [Bacteriovoracaceae bacterium]|nr:hypothetical protein [Bacteriovoracaceae bacterium]
MKCIKVIDMQDDVVIINIDLVSHVIVKDGIGNVYTGSNGNPVQTMVSNLKELLEIMDKSLIN